MALNFITAEITVENRVPASSKFSLLGATLCNAPIQGYLLPHALSGIPTANYGAAGDPEQMLVGVTAEESLERSEALFCYQSPTANKTFVIVKASFKGKEGYYRLDLREADKTTPLALLGGDHYKFNILSVSGPGAATAAEAMQAGTDDVEYLINVGDDESYDIITNGVQYLGVSNSEYWMYNTNYVNEYESYFAYQFEGGKLALKELPSAFLATVLTYTADLSWSEGSVTASKGIRLLDQAENKAVEVLPLPIRPTAQCELRIFMDDYVTEGTLDIKIGDLHKQIKIRRMGSINILGDTIDLGKEVSFASAQTVSNTQTTSKDDVYSLANTTDGTALITGNGSSAADPSQHLYLRVRNQFKDVSTLSYVDYCYGRIFLHRSTSEGRVRIDLAVDNRGCYPWGDYSNTIQHLAVGSFHKNSERGERLVQIPQCWFPNASSVSSGRWVAKVIKGQDFIRLGSWDKDLSMTDGRFDGDPETRLVEGDTIQIFGKDPIVRFRIGLTSTNEGNPNRYGLVQIIFVEARPQNRPDMKMKMNNFIFIRQGEQDDYILTPGQQYESCESPSTTFTAPNILFSPYELIDPTMGKGGSDLGDHTLITSSVKPVFADYPSWIGYDFQWGGDRMIHARNPSTPITNWNAAHAPTTYKDPCPAGYITPAAEIGGTAFINTMRCQVPSQPFGNAYGYGHYMDGYMDRHIECRLDQVVTVYNYGYERTWGLSAGTSDPAENKVKTSGFVLFDPDTFHSLYIPLSYARKSSVNSNENGSWASDRLIGLFQFLWTRNESATNPDNGILAYLDISNTNNPETFQTDFFAKSWATRVRCIKDPGASN